MIRLATACCAVLLTNLALAQSATSKTPAAPTCLTINGQTTPSTCATGTTLLAYLQTLGANRGGVLSGQTADPSALPCVKADYEKQREAWASRLNGAAAEEAARSLADHIALQADLQKLGFLSRGAALGVGPAAQSWRSGPRDVPAHRLGGSVRRASGRQSVRAASYLGHR